MYESILGRIAGLKPGSRANVWHGRCPCLTAHAHGDRSGSLRLWIDEAGRLRVRCFKGCERRDISAALGVRAAEWYPPTSGIRVRISGMDVMAGEIVATYDYQDESGNLLYQSVKLKREDGSKSFYQRRPMPDGGWANTLGGGYFRKNEAVWYQVAESEKDKYRDLQQFNAVRLVPFHLPFLAAHRDFPVVVVEGEKDVLTLEAAFAGCKVCVTTNPMGAKKWPWYFGEWLRGRRVTIVPDYDDVGFEHGCMVCANAIAFGCESVRLVRWPIGVDLKAGGDVTDWLEGKPDKRAAVTELIKGQAEEYKRSKA